MFELSHNQITMSRCLSNLDRLLSDRLQAIIMIKRKKLKAQFVVDHETHNARFVVNHLLEFQHTDFVTRLL